MKRRWETISGFPIYLPEEVQSDRRQNSHASSHEASKSISHQKSDTKSHANTKQNKESLGKLRGVFMNPETAQIIAFLVGFTTVLSPVDIEKWNKNSVQISKRSAIVSPTEILRIQTYGLRKSYLNGKKVLSKSGRRMGKVRDFTIETTNSSILTFTVSKRFLGIEWHKRIFPFKDVFEVTEKAIILALEPEDTVRASKPAVAPAL